MIGVVAGIGLATLGIILATAWAVLFQVVKQNGRILARIDILERRLESRGKQPVESRGKQPVESRGKQPVESRGKEPVESRIPREGLKAGAPAPLFDLPGIGGETVSLAAFRGRRVLLVFSDPECGPCDRLAPSLVGLHRKHRGNGLAVVMVGRGDPDANRRKANEHGYEFPVALQRRWEISKDYGIFATPVAFLIGENGVIQRGVATGADEILALAH